MLSFLFCFCRGLQKLRISPGYPQTLHVPQEGLEITPTTSSILYFPESSQQQIDIAEKYVFIIPSESFRISPLNNQAVDIEIGLLNTPSRSCQWKVVYDPYYSITANGTQDNKVYCYAFFNQEPNNTLFVIRTIDIDEDDSVHIYTDNNQLIYTMASYDTFKYNANAFTLIYRTDSYLVEGTVLVYDSGVYLEPKDYSFNINETMEINLMPNHYFIIHNPDKFTVWAPITAVPYQNRAYLINQISTVVISPIYGQHMIYFSVIMRANEVCEETFIYNGNNASFLLKTEKLHDRCIVLSNPYVIDYYFYVRNVADEIRLYKPNGNFIVGLTDDMGYIERQKSVFIHITNQKHSESSIFCLEKSQIISPAIPEQHFVQTWCSSIDALPAVPYAKSYNRFSTGFYQYYIPDEGSNIQFKSYTIYVFHNPQHFTAFGTGITFLSDKDFVLNVTDVQLAAVIKPNNGATNRILNISVLNYKKLNLFQNCNSVDVVTIAALGSDGFTAAYNSKVFAGKNANFSVESDQRICIWYIGSSMLSLESYRQNLDEFSSFEFQYESKGQFTEPRYTNFLRSRSILSKWSTLSEVTSDGQGGSTVTVSKTGTPCGEKSGAFRGTTSYMDFPFTYYNGSFSEILNLGTREPKIVFSHEPLNRSNNLTLLQISLIAVAAAVVGIVLIAVLCTIGKRNKTKDIKDKKDNDSLSDVDDLSDNAITNSNITTNHAYNYMTNKSSNTSGSATVSSNDGNAFGSQKKDFSSSGSSYFKSNLTLPERKDPPPRTFGL